MVVFFKLAGELLEHLQLPDDNEKVVLNVAKGANRRIFIDLNSRLVLSLYQKGNMGFMLGRDYVDRNRNDLEIDDEVEFADMEPIVSFLSFQYHFVKQYSDKFKSEWLRCCKEYLPNNSSSLYFHHMLKYKEDNY